MQQRIDAIGPGLISLRQMIVAQLLTNCYYVVISDKGYQYDTQQTIPFYRDIAKGGPFLDQGTRHVLTTRNDGRIKFEFLPGSWGPRW